MRASLWILVAGRRSIRRARSRITNRKRSPLPGPQAAEAGTGTGAGALEFRTRPLAMASAPSSASSFCPHTHPLPLHTTRVSLSSPSIVPTDYYEHQSTNSHQTALFASLRVSCALLYTNYTVHILLLLTNR